MANWGGTGDRDSTCEETSCEILPIETKALFCVWKHVRHVGIILPTSLTFLLQILKSMPAITLLFPLLNTNQIWEQCQSV